MAIWETIVGGMAFEVIRRVVFPGGDEEKGGGQGKPAALRPGHAHTPQEIAAAQQAQAERQQEQAAKAWRMQVPLDVGIHPNLAEEVYSAIEDAPPEVLDALSMNALRMGYPVSAMHCAQRAVQLRQAMLAPEQQAPQAPSFFAHPGQNPLQTETDPEQAALNRKHAGLIRKQVELNKMTPEERMAFAEQERQANLLAVGAVMKDQEAAIRAADPNNPQLKIAADLAIGAVVAAQEKAMPRIVNPAQEEHDFNQTLLANGVDPAEALKQAANGKSTKSIEMLANNPAQQASNGETATS